MGERLVGGRMLAALGRHFGKVTHPLWSLGCPRGNITIFLFRIASLKREETEKMPSTVQTEPGRLL